MTIYESIVDTPGIAQLRELYERQELIEREAREKQREIAARVDEIRLSLRPTYPTQDQRDGVAEAIRQIDAGEKPKTHYGHRASRTVVIDPKRMWMHIGHGAPTVARGAGGYLWGFTDDELDALWSLFDGTGYRMVDHWRSDGGVSLHIERIPS